MSEQLKPCPFCGGTNIDPSEWSQNDGKSGPGCGDCGALGESVEAWNRRATPADLDAEGLPPLPDVLNRYTNVGLTGYTADQVRQAQREAIAADRRNRALQELADQAQELDMGYGPVAPRKEE